MLLNSFRRTGSRLGLIALFAFAMSFALGALSCQASTAPRPPVARIVPHTLEAHGQTRVDDYYWLRERENPDVIAYLKAENAYADSVMAPYAGQEEALFREIIGRIKKDDASVPYLKRGYFYYDRYEGTGEYSIFCRKPGWWARETWSSERIPTPAPMAPWDVIPPASVRRTLRGLLSTEKSGLRSRIP
jgi:hypothetical protein